MPRIEGNIPKWLGSDSLPLAALCLESIGVYILLGFLSARLLSGEVTLLGSFAFPVEPGRTDMVSRDIYLGSTFLLGLKFGEEQQHLLLEFLVALG